MIGGAPHAAVISSVLDSRLHISRWLHESICSMRGLTSGRDRLYLNKVSTIGKYAVACIRESNHSRSSWTLQLFATNGFIFIYLVLSLIFTLIASQVCMSYILLHCFRAFLFSESSCVEAKFSRAILIEVCFKLHAAWSGAQSQGTFRSEVNKRTEATPSSTWSTGTKRTLTVMTLSARKDWLR